MKGDFNEARYGYCKCGCGNKTTIAKKTDTKAGSIRGEPRRFLHGHNSVGKCNFMYGKIGEEHPMHGRTGKKSHLYGRLGENANNWNGGRTIEKQNHTSYALVYMPEHPRSDRRGYVKEHIMIVEKALGWPLPPGAVIHHVNGDGINNELSNLMVFKDNGEHMKFHAKQRRIKNG